MRPITVQPGYTENDVKNVLASGQFVQVDCYTITLASGTTLRYNTGQSLVAVYPTSGEPLVRSYLVGPPLFEGVRFKASLGVEVDEQTLKIVYRANDLVEGMPYPVALMTGRFDGARIARDRFVGPNWGVWAGGFPLFNGRVSSLDSVGRSQCEMKVKSDSVLLDVEMPRSLWQPSCRNTWGDDNCGIDRSLWATLGTALAGSTSSKILWAGATSSMVGGTVQIACGDGITRFRTVKAFATGELELSYPVEGPSLVGVSFTVYPGCDRSYARCGFFSNQNRFRGYPFIPVAETAI